MDMKRKSTTSGFRRLSGAMAIVSAAVAMMALIPITPPSTMAQDAQLRESGVGVMVGEEPGEGIFAMEDEMAILAPESAIDLNDADVADYDILFNIPVQLENIHDNVDRFRVVLKVGQSEDLTDWTFSLQYQITRDLAGGAYNGTVAFAVKIPPEGLGAMGQGVIDGDPPETMYPTDINAFVYYLYLHDTISGNYERAVTSDWDVPLWRKSSTPLYNLAFGGRINWE